MGRVFCVLVLGVFFVNRPSAICKPHGKDKLQYVEKWIFLYNISGCISFFHVLDALYGKSIKQNGK